MTERKTYEHGMPIYCQGLEPVLPYTCIMRTFIHGKVFVEDQRILNEFLKVCKSGKDSISVIPYRRTVDTIGFTSDI